MFLSVLRTRWLSWLSSNVLNVVNDSGQIVWWLLSTSAMNLSPPQAKLTVCTPCRRKGCHQTHGGNFVKSQPIFKSFTTGKRRKFTIKPITQHTLSMLPHYLGNLKVQICPPFSFYPPSLPSYLFPSGAPLQTPARKSEKHCELKIMHLVAQNQQSTTYLCHNWNYELTLYAN